MQTDIYDYAKPAMLDYATAVNLDRSVPDLYDGLKPVMRRVLWATSLQTKGQLVKSARVVGDTIGKYHPHGDVSTYGAMVTLVQQNQPPLLGKGNWGSMIDSPAAYRYTNVMLSEYGQSFFGKDYINKEVTTFVPNFDDKEIEPVTLPAMLPNIIINGSSGIGWGTTTSLPSFKVDSVIKMLMRILSGEKGLTSRDFALTLKMDFRYGGKLVNTKENKQAWLAFFNSNQGQFKVKSDYIVDDVKRQIIITSWPNQGIESFLKKVRLFPETERAYNYQGELDYIVICKKGYNNDQFKAWVAKIDKLLTTGVSYKINVTSRTAKIEDGVVSFDTEFLSLSVPHLIMRWLRQRVELEVRSLNYRIKVKNSQINYARLLIYAVSILDVIFASLRTPDPVVYLVKHSKMNKEQAESILDLKVRQLSKMDDRKIKEQLKVLKQELSVLQSWLKNPKAKIHDDLELMLKTIK